MSQLDIENLHSLLSNLESLPLLSFRDSYTKIRELGRGSYGIVYLGYQISDLENRLAIKENRKIRGYIDNSDFDRALATIEMILTEFKIIKRLSEGGCRPGILCYDNFFMDIDTDYIYLVTKYIEGLTLTKFVPLLIQHYPKDRVHTIMMSILLEILTNLSYVHESGIIHSDIKPDNIMVRIENGKYQAVIIDFGLSCFSKLSDCTERGSLIYRAPETFIESQVYQASDIWSLAISFYDLLIADPYPDSTTPLELKTTITYPKTRLDFKTGYLKLDDIINSMLVFDYKNRPNVETLLNK